MAKLPSWIYDSLPQKNIYQSVLSAFHTMILETKIRKKVAIKVAVLEIKFKQLTNTYRKEENWDHKVYNINLKKVEF